MTDFASEWIASRTDLIDMFDKPFRGMPQDSIGLSIMATNDFPRALAALKAVLAIEPMPNHLDMQPRDRDYADGHNDALRLAANAITATLRSNE